MGRKEVPIGGGGNISKRTASRTACVSSMPSKERSGYPQGRSMRDVSSGVGAKLTKRRSDICSACMSCMRITKKERSGFAQGRGTGYLSSGGGKQQAKSRRVSCTARVECMCTAEEQRSGSAQGGSTGVA